jgi:hypothetical protein
MLVGLVMDVNLLGTARCFKIVMYKVQGTMYNVHGTRYSSVQGTKLSTVQGSKNNSRYKIQCIRYIIHNTQCMVHGTW